MTIRHNVLANLVSQGIAVLMSVAFIPVYIYYLGIEAYGLIGIFVLLQTWLLLLDLGLGPAISREMARFTSGSHTPSSIRSLLRGAELLLGVVALTIAVAVWAASGFLATTWLQFELLEVSSVATSLALMGVIIGLRLHENLYRASLLGLQHQVAAGVLGSGVATARAVGAVAVLAWVSNDVVSFFVWQALASAIAVIAYRLTLSRSLPRAEGPPSVAPLRNIRRFASGALVISVLGMLLSQADKLVLSSVFSLSAFAVYSLAYTVASGVRLLGQPIDQAILPRMTELHQRVDTGGMSALYHTATQYNVVLMGGAAAFLIVFGEDFLTLWTQSASLTMETYPVLRILVIGMLLNGLMSGPYHLQMAAGWTGLLVRVNLAMVLVFLPLTVALALGFGLVGAATAWVLVNVGYLVVVTRLMHRRLLPGELGIWLSRDIAIPLVAAAIAAVGLATLASATGLPSAVYLPLALVAIMIAASLAAGRVRRGLAAWIGFSSRPRITSTQDGR